MKSINLNSIKFSDNQIIIGPSYLKKNVIDFTSLKYNIKYIDYAELRSKYLYEYKDSALVYLDKKYNYIPEIGKIILNNLYEVDTSKVYKSSKLNLITNLIIPSSKNEIISSLKINISYCLIGVIMGEFLSCKKGIGYLILYGTQVFNLSLVMCGILLLLLLSFIFVLIINYIDKKTSSMN